MGMGMLVPGIVGMRVGVGVAMRTRGGANRDRDDGLVGYAAAIPLGEDGQALQNARKQ